MTRCRLRPRPVLSDLPVSPLEAQTVAEVSLMETIHEWGGGSVDVKGSKAWLYAALKIWKGTLTIPCMHKTVPHSRCGPFSVSNTLLVHSVHKVMGFKIM